jgi:hypothetical protein
MFHRLSSEHINRSVGNIHLQYPNDSFFFAVITFHFVCLAAMIISLSSSSSMFLPLLTLLLVVCFSMLSIVYLLHAMKEWAQLVFSACNSAFVIEEILRKQFSIRARRRVQEDDIGDVNDPIKQDKTLRIDMNRLSTALKKNLFA